MKGGGGYKLIQIQGDWGTQYHMLWQVAHGREAVLKRKIPTHSFLALLTLAIIKLPWIFNWENLMRLKNNNINTLFMRSILNFIVLLTGVAFFTACEKVDDLPNYNVGNPVVLWHQQQLLLLSLRILVKQL